MSLIGVFKATPEIKKVLTCVLIIQILVDEKRDFSSRIIDKKNFLVDWSGGDSTPAK